jgi:hypothetical protein
MLPALRRHEDELVLDQGLGMWAGFEGGREIGRQVESAASKSLTLVRRLRLKLESIVGRLPE